MAKIAVIGVTLILAIIVGLSLRPDDGTPYSAKPLDAASTVAGTSHAKPLPRILTVVDLFRAFVAAIAALVLAGVTTWLPRLPIEFDIDRRSNLLWSMARARRGPPALA